ncbi:MAG: hypothetical protein QXO49_04035 [Candidatus Bathyarchaeia archaeon]
MKRYPVDTTSKGIITYPTQRNKVTVGVYLDKTLAEKARKHGLNLLKILEEALKTIIDRLEGGNCQNNGNIGTEGSDLWGRGRALYP